MIYETGSRQLEAVGEISRYKENQVLICQETDGGYSRYIVWQINSREKAKQILEELYREKESCCLECFTQGTDSFFAFPYQEPRPLQGFWTIQNAGQEQRKEIYQSMVLACISSKLPFPLMYLAIAQDQMNISCQNEIYFTLDVDLSQWNKQRREAACVQACAEKLFFFLEQENTRWEKNMYRLVKKKTERGSYQKFTELYRDICLMEAESGRKNRWRIPGSVKNTVYRIICWSCGVLTVLALIIFVSQLIWGEIPLFRLFEPSFTKIGTESLLQ